MAVEFIGFKSVLFKFIPLAVMLLGLPLLGIIVAGYPVSRYLEFPPQTLYVQHAAFSLIAFSASASSYLPLLLLW